MVLTNPWCWEWWVEYWHYLGAQSTIFWSSHSHRLLNLWRLPHYKSNDQGYLLCQYKYLAEICPSNLGWNAAKESVIRARDTVVLRQRSKWGILRRQGWINYTFTWKYIFLNNLHKWLLWVWMRWQCLSWPTSHSHWWCGRIIKMNGWCFVLTFSFIRVLWKRGKWWRNKQNPLN